MHIYGRMENGVIIEVVHVRGEFTWTFTQLVTAALSHKPFSFGMMNIMINYKTKEMKTKLNVNATKLKIKKMLM